MKPSKGIEQIKPGQQITADYLNRLSGAVDAPARTIVSGQQNARVFGEISRVSTTVSITPASLDPIEFEQMDKVTFKNGLGEVITLVFNNPIVPPP